MIQIDQLPVYFQGGMVAVARLAGHCLYCCLACLTSMGLGRCRWRDRFSTSFSAGEWGSLGSVTTHFNKRSMSRKFIDAAKASRSSSMQWDDTVPCYHREGSSTRFHQLTTSRTRSKPPLSCDPGFTILPCRTVNLTIPSQSSGLTLDSHMHWPASSPFPSSSPFRYISTLAEYLCLPTWLMKYIPTPPGRSSCTSRYSPSGRR